MAPAYTSGRRGPNVSQYLRQLNTVNEKPLEDDFTFEDDLAMFTNTQFFDFETGQHMDYQAPPAKPDCDPSPTTTTVNPDALASPIGDLSNLDFMPGDFNFSDFNSYPASGVPSLHEGLGNLQPLQPNPQTHYSSPVPPHPHPHPAQAAYVQPVSRPSEPTSRPEPYNDNGNGRPVSNFEEQSRLAADEDKRRRNTAASARFRIKKKQREQALEKTAKEMSDKVTQLESRINLLETENRWLKNLVMEKNDGNEEIAAMFKEFDSKHKANKASSEAASSDVKDEN
ncbi:regulatory protein cys-3 [Sodiomyces alkalinus F11]|uniref:Regulatory protein cys-3 n=1 Tax=Sodiomyces alkalinus (strain CBS 110278 / VKM F-3762 / F11) TaxID=1314773 RepID=A0A3N2Q9P9_SODAK|nr:regulatory protein cys-3 [Sodiomyces alkalinus F11]ROT43494.1 regulatory protein cys-3 [Sodiomyces alkalinus F11]